MRGRRAPVACATEPVALTVACPRGAGVRAVRGRWRRPGASSTTAAATATLGEALATCPGLPRTAIHHDPIGRGVTRDVPLGGRPGTRHQLGEHPRLPRHVHSSPRRVAVGSRRRRQDGTIHAGGPHPDHAAAHTYETKGGYRLSVDVVWSLQTNYGSATTAVGAEQPYQVIEIRSVLTG